MTLLQNRLADFPENPEDGFEIREDLPNGGYVIWKYSQQFNQWTYESVSSNLSGYLYTDQVLVRVNDRHGRALDPADLKTQKDVNHYLNDQAGNGTGGEGSGDLEERVELLEKALLPWVEFTDEYRSCYYNAGSNYVNASVRMNQYWNSSPAGTWTWAWMVKFPDSDEWTDVDDLSEEAARSIGYDGTEQSTYLYLYPTGELPEIEVQLKVTDELEGFTPIEKWSDPFFPGPVWNEKQVDASTFTVRKTGRVRARNADGTFRADDPRTPDVNEAWVEE